MSHQRRDVISSHTQSEVPLPVPFQCPPSYEDAIQRPLLNQPSAPMTLHLSGNSNGNYNSSGLTPQDFRRRPQNPGDPDQDDTDMEDEHAYEESRPLKMGKIPDVRAQYTFIQPKEIVGETQSNASILRNSSMLQRNSGVFTQQQPPYAPGASSYTNPTVGSPAVSRSAPAGSVIHDQKSDHRASFQTQGLSAGDSSSSSQSTTTAATVPAESSSSPNAASTPLAVPPSSTFAAYGSLTPAAGVPQQSGNLIHPQDISIASFTTTKNGVQSSDKVLADPYQLYRYFVAHNDRPSMKLQIRGHHTDKKESHDTDSTGHRTTIVRDVEVEDFKIEFDLTQYIDPKGVLYTLPDPHSGEQYTIRQVMEKYADDESLFKELHMPKVVAWDYQELTRAVMHIIRSVGYRHPIEISYPCTNYIVKATSPSPVDTFLRNGWTKFFCFVTLIGVIVYPTREVLKRVKNKSLQSEFEMMISTRDFYARHYWDIVDQVQYR